MAAGIAFIVLLIFALSAFAGPLRLSVVLALSAVRTFLPVLPFAFVAVPLLPVYYYLATQQDLSRFAPYLPALVQVVIRAHVHAALHERAQRQLIRSGY